MSEGDEDSVRVEMKLIVNNNNPLPLRGLPLRQGENMRGNRQQITDNNMSLKNHIIRVFGFLNERAEYAVLRNFYLVNSYKLVVNVSSI